jgi:hypothetical protein
METKAVRRTMLCSEIINLHLQARAGCDRELKANLEEIWPGGAILWTDMRIRQYTSLWFHGGGFEFRGQVMAHTVLRGSDILSKCNLIRIADGRNKNIGPSTCSIRWCCSQTEFSKPLFARPEARSITPGTLPSRGQPPRLRSKRRTGVDVATPRSSRVGPGA